MSADEKTEREKSREKNSSRKDDEARLGLIGFIVSAATRSRELTKSYGGRKLRGGQEGEGGISACHITVKYRPEWPLPPAIIAGRRQENVTAPTFDVDLSPVNRVYAAR